MATNNSGENRRRIRIDPECHSVTIRLAGHKREAASSAEADSRPEEAILVVDCSGTILFANQAGSQLFGSAEVVLPQGTKLEDLVEPEDCEVIRNLFSEAPAKNTFDLQLRYTGAKTGAAHLRGTFANSLSTGVAYIVLHGIPDAADADSPSDDTRASQLERLERLQRIATSLIIEVTDSIAAISNYSNGALMRMNRGSMQDSDWRDLIGEIAEAARQAVEASTKAREFVRKLDSRKHTDSPKAIS